MKNLRAPFFQTTSQGCFNTLSAFVTVMLSLQTLTKYNLGRTLYLDSSLQLKLNNFIRN